MKVLVLGGGDSDERVISLRSAAAVAAALQRGGHEVTEYDTANGLKGLEAAVQNVDVVFPVLHGKNGEDGVVQKALETTNVSFVGSGSAASQLCFDKAKFKELLQQNGIQTPTGGLVGKDFLQSEQSMRPFVLKPNDGGSSIDTYIVRKPNGRSVVDPSVFDRHETMLYEELITGKEITIALLDGKALPVIEIVPPASGEFDYDNKYNGKTQELCPPQSVPEQLQAQASRLSEQVQAVSGARHFARVDIMISASNELYVLELNTIPGMTDQSLFPKAASTAGIAMQELVDRLVKMAINTDR